MKAPLLLGLALLATTTPATLAVVLDDDEPVGYEDTPQLPGQEWRVHDKWRPVPAVVDPGPTFEAPPSDAVVLFDGTSTDAWNGGPWAIEDGAMVVNGKGSITTKAQFGDCQLHLEWAAPAEPNRSSQGRGNSGVFLMGKYEVQVLNSYENRSYADGQASALYGQWPPLVNACRPSEAWQTYDILFRAPRFADDGSLESPAVVTVLHNGVVTHHAKEILGATTHRAVARYSAHGPTGPIQLQDHGNAIRYRNIWIRPIGDYDAAGE